jgi:hypothetical protein
MRPVQQAYPDRKAAGCHLLQRLVSHGRTAPAAGKALCMVPHVLHAQEGQQYVLLPIMCGAGAHEPERDRAAISRC